jgi:predicted anti-sigma-YlaC factor YlaD
MGGDAIARARKHYERAVELSDGKRSAPYLALAESVLVTTQDRSGFEAALGQALDVDPLSVPELKLENLAMQERAHWLLQRTDYLFSR